MKFKFNILSIKKSRIKEIHWFLASHAFSVILLLVLLSILWGMFLFYQYIILVQAKEQEISNGTIKFDYSAYQAVIKEWQLKDQLFQKSKDAGYSNPFTTP